MTAPNHKDLMMDAHPPQICARLEAVASRFPDAIAVTAGGEAMSYSDLVIRMDRLGSYLASLGVGPGTIVGICVERSLDCMVGLLAILKAGAAYLPLDPAFPPNRIAFMLKDSGASLVLTQRQFTALVKTDIPRIFLDADEPDIWAMLEKRHEIQAPEIGPETLAYVIYTSGSTGRPKGVKVPHRALSNLLNSMSREPGLGRTDVLAAITTISFDIAALELFLPLWVGGTVDIVSRETAMDGSRLARHLDEVGATGMQATPTSWRLLLDCGWTNPNGITMLCGGEVLSRDLANSLLESGAPLWNMYGPTETTIWSTIHRVKHGSEPVPIGRPIDNTYVALLDDELNPASPGDSGELVIGGQGVAHGYLNRAELTAERFIEDPAVGLGAFYRTGDIARVLPNGELQYLGRIDNQIKIRGFRVELGEIELNLERHADIRQVQVVPEETERDEPRLAAYIVVGREGPPRPRELRDYLAERLPDYMIPACFYRIDAFPTTPNGKVDRKALSPARAERLREESLASPKSALEKYLAESWARLIGLERIGAHEKFFEIGGTSLDAARFVIQLQEDLKDSIPVISLFQAPTIAAYAKYLEQNHESAISSRFGNERSDRSRATSKTAEKVSSRRQSKRMQRARA